MEEKTQKLTKRDIITKLAEQTELSQKKATEVINVLFNTENGIFARELQAGNKITLTGFGTFGTRVREARAGTHPSTRKPIEIAARTNVFFRAGKTLKEIVNE